ncbi:MAG: hypothetical protein AB7P14_23385 [Blastocatellales bacterium]
MANLKPPFLPLIAIFPAVERLGYGKDKHSRRISKHALSGWIKVGRLNLWRELLTRAL